MLKTTLSVMLLSAAQNALAIQVPTTRPPKLTKEQLNEKVAEELATGDYEIGTGQCSNK